MRTVLLASLLTLSATTVSPTAVAAEDSFYLRGNLGSSYLDAGPRFEDNDSAYGLDFGWRFLPWLALEAGYNRLGVFAFDCGGNSCPGFFQRPIDLDSSELGLAGRVAFGETAYYGQARLGVHRWDSDYTTHETDPYYGVGVGYAFNERFNLSLNFDRYAADNVDADRLGLGLEVGF